jgi:transcriptional regulator with GAF, ATPase, and Fis domain
VILSPGSSLRLDLSLPSAGSQELTTLPIYSGGGGQDFVTDAEMKAQQRDNMRRALEYANWRISGQAGAAELLGLKPSTLTDRMHSFNLQKPAQSPKQDLK